MGWIFDSELGVKRVPDTVLTPTVIPPASFRGIDCAVLAARYVVYRRNAGLDRAPEPMDRISLPTAAGLETV